MSESKFKVGDRVAVYGHSEGGALNGFYGTVAKDSGNGWINVEWDCDDWLNKVERVHEKQCRRLKKRERMRIWVPIDADGKLLGERHFRECLPPFIEFVEVRRTAKP
jgi:hypothetical protein